MGFGTTLVLALFTAFAFAQNNLINIPAGSSTLIVVANALNTITWTNPSSGTVTIKLQQAPNITPDSGYVLACMLHFLDFLRSAGYLR
jgi:hypothetical protein